MNYVCPEHNFECHTHRAFLLHVQRMRCQLFAKLTAMLSGRVA